MLSTMQAAPAAASSSTLQQLQSAAPKQLLDDLLADSPSAAAEAHSLLIRALGDDSPEVCSISPAAPVLPCAD